MRKPTAVEHVTLMSEVLAAREDAGARHKAFVMGWGRLAVVIVVEYRQTRTLRRKSRLR